MGKFRTRIPTIQNEIGNIIYKFTKKMDAYEEQLGDINRQFIYSLADLMAEFNQYKDRFISHEEPKVLNKIKKPKNDILFELRNTDIDNEIRDDFIQKHHKKCKDSKTVGFSYIVSPGPIGIATDIKCNICDKTKDITNYNCW